MTAKEAEQAGQPGPRTAAANELCPNLGAGSLWIGCGEHHLSIQYQLGPCVCRSVTSLAIASLLDPPAVLFPGASLSLLLDFAWWISSQIGT